MGGVFGEQSTTDEVLDGIDLSGKRILVTGVSAGIGVETARALAARGAQIVGAARGLEKARVATAAIPSIELVECDLASLASVRACADALVVDGRPIDIVIANAGVMACPKEQTADGFERQFGTNHLGHFVLVNRIASLIPPGGRLVSLASSGHRFSDVDLDDPNFVTTPYTPFVAYGRAKTANILFAVEFDRRHRDRGIRATAVHPGGIKTELTRYMDDDARDELKEAMAARAEAGGDRFYYKSIEQGAATSVWAAVTADADAVGGRYCEDCHVAEVVDGDIIATLRGGVRPYAVDPDNARALWAKSEEMVGERF